MENGHALHDAGLDSVASLPFEDHDDRFGEPPRSQGGAHLFDEGPGGSGTVAPPSGRSRAHDVGGVDDEHRASLVDSGSRPGLPGTPAFSRELGPQGGGLGRRYAAGVPSAGLGATPSPTPRLVVVREFGDIKAVTAMLQAAYPVFIVTRASEEDEKRVLDLLSGWALGSGGDLDRIGPNTVLARPVDCPPIPLRTDGITSAIEEVFATDGPPPLGRDEEERLLPQAVMGSEGARRRIVDSYTELATLFALKIRPRSVSEAVAVRMAQEELDRLVRFPSNGPLLVSLVEGIIKKLVR
jgi:Cell division protein SepF